MCWLRRPMPLGGGGGAAGWDGCVRGGALFRTAFRTAFFAVFLAAGRFLAGARFGTFFDAFFRAGMRSLLESGSETFIQKHDAWRRRGQGCPVAREEQP